MQKTQIAALVAVNFGGSLAAQLGSSVVLDANSIKAEAWTPHHGPAADGTQVNSPRSINIGESTILQIEEGGRAIGMPKAYAEVFAKSYLKGTGKYDIELKANVRAAA